MVNSNWKNGLEHEINHWKVFFKDSEIENHLSRNYLLKHFYKNINFPDDIKNILDKIEKEPINILDVGSGPIPLLIKKYNKEISLICIDALANEYYKLYKDIKRYPSIIPIECKAENLTGMFPENYFDFVYSKNCIDHTIDPIKCIESMIKVGNKYIMIDLYINTGINQKYEGLHQWNFYIKENNIFMSDKDENIVNVSSLFYGMVSEMECKEYIEEYNGYYIPSINILIKK